MGLRPDSLSTPPEWLSRAWRRPRLTGAWPARRGLGRELLDLSQSIGPRSSLVVAALRRRWYSSREGSPRCHAAPESARVTPHQVRRGPCFIHQAFFLGRAGKGGGATAARLAARRRALARWRAGFSSSMDGESLANDYNYLIKIHFNEHKRNSGAGRANRPVSAQFLSHRRPLRWIYGEKDIETKAFSGTPGVIRTPDPLLRRQVLYPAELRAHNHI